MHFDQLTGPEHESAPATGNVIGQGTRLLDIGVFGPLMILGALNREPAPWMRLVMLGIGIGTVIYSAKNYLDVMRNIK